LKGFSTDLGSFTDEIELQTIGPGLDNEPAGQIFNAYQAVPKPFNLLNSLRRLLTTGVTALNTYRPIIQQFFAPGVALTIAASAAIALIANSDYSTPSEPESGPQNQTYLLTTIYNCPQIVFKFFILQLPDKGNGIQIVSPVIPWQEYR
jgi:hypothetical protein